MPEKSDHDMIIEIHTCLLGSDGQGGLCREFEEHKKADIDFKRGYYKFRLWIYILAAFLTGTGIFSSVSIVELMKLR